MFTPFYCRKDAIEWERISKTPCYGQKDAIEKFEELGFVLECKKFRKKCHEKNLDFELCQNTT